MPSIEFQISFAAQTRITAALETMVKYFDQEGKNLVALQVGACNGKIENDHFQDVIKGQTHVEAYLVEAVGWLFDELVEVMAPDSAHIHCYHAALGARDDVRSFYSVSPQYGADHPEAESWKRYQIGSFTDGGIKCHVPEKYILSEEVLVQSPETFLKRVGVNPQDLNLLITDAEGFDGEIVGAFLEITQPEVIVYEHHVMSTRDHDQLRRSLEQNGYESKLIGYDVLAWRQGEKVT